MASFLTSFCTLNNFLSVKQFIIQLFQELGFCTLNNFLSVKPAEQDYLVGQVFLYSQ